MSELSERIQDVISTEPVTLFMKGTPQFVNGAVSKRPGERLVDEAMLVEQGKARETRARDRHLKVVTTAGPVLDAQLRRVRERILEQGLQRLGRHTPHASHAGAPGSRGGPSGSERRSASLCWR